MDPPKLGTGCDHLLSETGLDSRDIRPRERHLARDQPGQCDANAFDAVRRRGREPFEQ